MYQASSEQHRRIVAAVVRSAVKPSKSMRNLDWPRFVRAYYASVDAQDLASREPTELAAAALSHLMFASRRRRTALVRVFNPTLREHGYTSPHTVIEMVNDDMPFLVDSINLALTQRALTLHFLTHPIFAVSRDGTGTLQSVRERGEAPEDGAQPSGRRLLLESFQHIEVDRIVDPAALNALASQIARSMSDVRVACADWGKMRGATRQVAQELSSLSEHLDAGDLTEALALLAWMEDRHFTFLGYREYRLQGRKGQEALLPVVATGLGILRRGHRPSAKSNRSLARDIRRQSRSRDIVLVTKANLVSTVHRSGHLDYVGIKHFDAKGRLIGEKRFLGLWTSSAYNSNPREIPVLRHKVAQVVEQFALAPDSHDGKALLHILESFPRDELFQASVAELNRTVTGILGLQERPRVRVLLRRDGFRRFYSCLVFVPREKYNTQVRQRIEKVIREAFSASGMESQVQIAESNLARILFFARTAHTQESRIGADALERRVAAAVRSWSDGFKAALLSRLDEAYALQLFDKYALAFPAAYTEDFNGDAAALDVSFLEAAEKEPARLHLDIYRPEPRRKDKFFLKIFRNQDAIPISDLLPMLENMGLKVIAERPYELEFPGGRRAWIQDLELVMQASMTIQFEALAREIKSAFTAVWTGRMDSDSFNQLTLSAGIPWRIVIVMRAYCRYLLQTGLPFSQGYIAQVLVNNAPIARSLADLFIARFDPALADTARKSALARLDQRIRAKLEEVTRSDEDRILRALWSALAATVRTNAYQIAATGDFKDYLSFKLESQKLRELPLPKPMFEVFVFSTRMEGVHLRMGFVARGGIRWSDRREDFRTEVLGLMKAQQVKNTVIVPVGAKGGFVVRRPLVGDRESQLAEVVACYQTLIRGLLDLTDNIVEDEIIAPPRVVRHDGDDAYLVVAADKGTATFSDIANAISEQYGFWLGDAFASGGSAGYDHKKMAITARGAWECVKRHFREIDVDITTTPFTVAGVGDMSGDVFGNGMLRERTTRLVAAFDHRDIFIDPAPDPQKSFAERARLFELPRSSWQDYDKSLISDGGGVFSRGLKEITLSPQAQKLIGLASPKTNPQQLISALLKMPADLLWFGGIGTYVRSSTEADDAVGDRANDAIRVTGAELACKVVGEGANLGMTQRSRIEAALRGVRLNTDAIDNSAGVNTSDVEVNIKVALAPAMRDGRLTREARNALLVEMTEDVAALVLRNNYLQTLALSLSARRGLEFLGFQQRLMQTLERRGLLDRAVEFLPDDTEIAERRRRAQPLTRPELAVLLAYAKLALYDELLKSSVPDDPYLGRELIRYFPAPLVEKFPDAPQRHRLRREIIATQLANSIINRGGPSFAVRIEDQTGAPAARIAAAFAAVRDSYEMTALNAAIDALDNKVPEKLQRDLYGAVEDLLHDRLVWFLRNADLTQGLAATVEHYRQGIAAVAAALDHALVPEAAAVRAARQAELTQQGVPQALARRFADLPGLAAAPDIVSVADRTGQQVADVAATYFAAEAYFRLDRIAGAAHAINVSDYFDRLALDRALDSIGDAERRLAAAMAGNGAAGAGALEAWIEPRRQEVDRVRAQVQEIATSGLTVSKLTVAASLLGDLVRP